MGVGGKEMKFGFFHAPWCGVCHVKAPVVREIAQTLGLPLEEWDIDEEAGRQVAERWRVEQVPTLALLDGERVRFRIVGEMITPENVRHLVEYYRG